jgi:hypothetical protein
VVTVDLAKLAGTSGKGEISLPDHVVNRFIADELGKAAGPVSGASIDAQDNDALVVRISMRGPRLLPVPTIAARIEQQPQLPQSAVLGLRWSVPGFGPIGLVAAPLLQYLKALPEEIAVDSDRLFIDLAAVARKQGLGDMLRHAERLEVHSRRGALVITFQFAIST